jgi:hypothetical protein
MTVAKPICEHCGSPRTVGSGRFCRKCWLTKWQRDALRKEASLRLGLSISDPPHLAALIERAKAWLASLTPEEREAHYRAQAGGWAEAEMAWNEDATVVVAALRPDGE